MFVSYRIISNTSYVVLYYIILYYNILYYIILYYIILYYIMGPPTYMRSVVGRNVVVRRMTVVTWESARGKAFHISAMTTTDLS